MNVTHFTQKSRFQDIGPFVKGILDEILESNWRILLESINPDVEIYMGDIIQAICTPIFDEYAIEAFFEGQSFFEAYQENLNKSSRSSNRLSVASVVAWLIVIDIAIALHVSSYFF